MKPETLTPKQRALLARQHLRDTAQNAGIDSLIRRSPGKTLGIALGVGVIFGMFPKLRSGALRSAPVIIRELAALITARG